MANPSQIVKDVNLMGCIVSAVPITGSNRGVRGVWIDYSADATLTAGSGTITSYVINKARYMITDRALFLKFDFTLTNAGTAGNNLGLSLPIIDGISLESLSNMNGMGVAREDANSGLLCQAEVYTPGNNVAIRDYNGNFRGSNGDRFIGDVTVKLV